MEKLDPRLNAYRTELADESLRGKIEAKNWVKGEPCGIVADIARVLKSPAPNAMQLTQALFGEECSVFEIRDGWAWIKLTRDGYVGYVEEQFIGPPPPKPTHRVSNVSTWLHKSPQVKGAVKHQLFMNSPVAVESASEGYALLFTHNFVFEKHLALVSEIETDFVAVAEKFLHVPYHWGGKTHAGTDCSGLVQISLQAAGIAALRDSDMQERSLGAVIADHNNLRRGDLVFWPGHVGIMQSATQLLHANGHHMKVSSEPLAEVVARSEKPITSVKRLNIAPK